MTAETGPGEAPRLDDEQRALIESGRQQVEPLASLLAARYRGLLDEGELRAAGEDGLISAARSYERDSEVPFGYFARYRIQGAMLDALRAASKRRRRDLELARVAAEAMQQEREHFAELHPDERDAGRLLQSMVDGLAGSMFANLVHEPPPDPEAAVADANNREKRAEVVERAMAELSVPHRTIMQLRHVEGLKLEACAARMKVSTTTAWRHERGAIARLRAILQRMGIHGA